MLTREDSKTSMPDEIKIIPTWAWIVAGIGLIVAQVVFDFFLPHHHPPHHPHPWARPFIGLLAGLVFGAYVLLIGYINRDAKRRAMSPTLWTILAIVIPNALGIILYFLLRLPLRSACPQCGCFVQSAFSFCPHCSYKLSPSCPQCQRSVGPESIFCPYCGTSLRNPVPPVTGASPAPTA